VVAEAAVAKIKYTEVLPTEEPSISLCVGAFHHRLRRSYTRNVVALVTWWGLVMGSLHQRLRRSCTRESSLLSLVVGW
jgi:hypothetical protein